LADALWNRFSHFFVGTYERIKLPKREYVNFETGLLVVLFRLAFPCRITPQMTFHFKMSHAKICHTIKVMVNGLYQISQLYFSDISIWIPRMPLYADLIWDATSGAAINVFGFIDGTLKKTCRPIYNQRQAYSGISDIMV
jgi:hypothetical protein